MNSVPISDQNPMYPTHCVSNLNNSSNSQPIFQLYGRRKTHKLHTCKKCQVHGVTSILRGHIICPYKNCECGQCLHVSILRQKAVIRKHRKNLIRREEIAPYSNYMNSLHSIPGTYTVGSEGFINMVQQGTTNQIQLHQTVNQNAPYMNWFFTYMNWLSLLYVSFGIHP